MAKDAQQNVTTPGIATMRETSALDIRPIKTLLIPGMSKIKFTICKKLITENLKVKKAIDLSQI